MCREDGSVRLIVEDKHRFSAIPDSWGRVVVILKGCSRFALVASDNGADLMMRVARDRPRLGAVNVREGLCEVFCSFGLMQGTLVMDPAALTLVLGGGRTIDADAFAGEMDAEALDVGSYSCVV